MLRNIQYLKPVEPRPFAILAQQEGYGKTETDEIEKNRSRPKCIQRNL